MKRCVLAAALAILSICAQANGQTLNGNVKDKAGEPVEFATVALLALPDSTVITGTATAADGSFELKGDGDLISVSMIGYLTALIPVSKFQNGKSIVLSEDAAILDEAVVSVELPKTELKGNAIVTNITGSVLEHSGNALNVLSKVPGMISRDGNLEVIGRGAPLYYINGRKVNDNSELRNLMSEDIKSIDVISNPGAAYGGEVRCVVIIRTVKHQGDGFSYALASQVKQHIYEKCHDFDPSWTVLDMNYRVKGFDIFTKTVYWDQRNYQISDIYGGTLTRKDEDIVRNFQEGQLDFRSHYGGWQNLLGMNWQISDNHSLGFKYEYSINTIGESFLWMEEDILADETRIDHLYATNDQKSQGVNSMNGNLYYDGTVGKLHINFNADFVRGVEGNATDIHEDSWTTPLDMTSETHSKNAMGAGKLIFSYPVWKGLLQAGTEETYVAAEQTYNITHSQIPSSDASLSENTIAGFAEYALALPFGQLSAGLRYEHTDFNYFDYVNSANDVRRIQNNWYPSLSFATQLGPVGVSLSYSGKTVRPNFSLLTTEIQYDNRFTYQTGDPLMENEIQRTLSLNAAWKWLSFSGNYEHVDNSFFQKAFPLDDEGLVMIQSTNCDDPLDKISAFLNAAPSVGVWYPRLTLGLEKQFFTTSLIDLQAGSGKREVAFNKPMYVVQFNNSFRFKHNWLLDCDYQYVSPFNQLLLEVMKPLQVAGIAVSKDFLKNNALNIRLSWNDIFDTNVQYVHLDYGNCIEDQSNDRFGPCIELRVSYRFNSANSKYKGTGAGQDAKNRM